MAQGGETLTIGDGAVVAAGTVISSDVPAATLVASQRVKAYASVTVPFTTRTSYKAFRAGLRPLKPRVRPRAQRDTKPE
jgi:tetrahydrodipicolinate N-succinyltransferase